MNWIAEDDTRTNRIEVKRGDIYRLEEGTIFYVQSHPDPTREKLRIHAIFDTILEENPSVCMGPNSRHESVCVCVQTSHAKLISELCFACRSPLWELTQISVTWFGLLMMRFSKWLLG